MKKLHLTGIAALLLATGAAHAQSSGPGGASSAFGGGLGGGGRGFGVIAIPQQAPRGFEACLRANVHRNDPYVVQRCLGQQQRRR